METRLLRQLPAVGRRFDDPTLGDSIRLYGRDAVKVQARREIAARRRELAEPRQVPTVVGLRPLPR